MPGGFLVAVCLSFWREGAVGEKANTGAAGHESAGLFLLFGCVIGLVDPPACCYPSSQLTQHLEETALSSTSGVAGGYASDILLGYWSLADSCAYRTSTHANRTTNHCLRSKIKPLGLKAGPGLQREFE